MQLNLTYEVISTFLAAIILFITFLLTFRSKDFKKNKAIFYFRLAWICTSILFVLEGFSYLLLSIPLNQIHAAFIIPPIIFTIFFINYTMKETIYSKSLILVVIVLTLYGYLLTQPQFFKITSYSGILSIAWVGLFGNIAVIPQTLLAVYLFMWGYRTWKHASFLVKRDSYLFFTGILIVSIGGSVFYMLNLWIPLLIFASNLAISIGVLIFSLALVLQPQLLYVLPFSLYRISVEDSEGHPLFDHDWSESEVNEIVFAGFMNAVQLMSEEFVGRGRVLDIQLEEGVILVHESEYITVGLVTSKSSKIVRSALTGFTNDFEETFLKQLKVKNTNMEEYETAYQLIKRYFSNFPSRLIHSEKQPLLLSAKLSDIPQELETKLKAVFSDQEQFESVLEDIKKSPFLITEDFLEQYDKLKDKADELEEKLDKLEDNTE